MCGFRFPVVLLLTVGIVAFVSTAEAKRFKRYPGDAEKEEQQADEKPAQNRAENREAEDKPGSEGSPADGAEGEKDEEDEESNDAAEESPGLFGSALHGRGWLKFEYIYTGEAFNNMRGGISTRGATDYRGLFDLAATADLEQASIGPGGTFFLLAENSHGRGLTERYVGDWQVLSNIDCGRQFTQVTEFWWERELLEGFLRVRLGKQDANAEFAVVDLGGDFVNSSFGMHHNIPMPAWPAAAMGVSTFFQFGEGLCLGVGVYDGAAEIGSWGVSGTGDIFSIYELKANWGLLGGRLPGDYHIGLWYHNGESSNPADPDIVYAGNHGLYMGIDQMLFKESWEEDDDQGLGAFAQWSWSPDERNDVNYYLGAGLVYKGLLPCRNDDVTGIGLARVNFSPFVPDRSPETAIEFFHKAQLTTHIHLQPDLQYICSPSGTERDAFVGGLRFELVL